MSERVIFDAALQIADPQARRAFVEKACAGKPEMLAAVESLLNSHDAAGSFLDIPAAEQIRADKFVADAASVRQQLPAPVQADASSVGHDEKTRSYQAGDADDEADETQPDLSFLQPSSKPGSIGVLGHYEVLQVLGQGGFGIVLKAFDEKLHRLVAIKVMNAQMAATSPPRKRFLREARAAAAIRHENIVQVHSVEELPLPYLVMEFIDGQTLRQKLDGAGPLEVPEVLHIGRQIASGLAAAQAMGLIHRDIKPGNILIEEVERRESRVESKASTFPRSQLSSLDSQLRVKITDFGLARAADDASLTRSGTISGTPMYMAPEQALGRALDHRADLFSLGSVLYELTCGRPPFRAATTVAVLLRVAEDTPRPMQEIIPEIPDWLVAIVTKLHAKNPEDRFQSAKEVADLLGRCQTELQTKGEVTCVTVAERVARPESSKGVESQSTTPFAKPQGVPPDSARRGSPDPAAPADRRSPRPGESTPKDGDLRSSPSAGSGDPRTARSNVSRWLVAAATVVLILAAAIVFQRANPTTTANLASREASAPGQAESTDSTNPDRRAAEWVLLIGGTIKIKENGEERAINSGRDLPEGPFELTLVDLNSNPQVSDAGLAHLKDCKNVTALDLPNTKVTDTGLAHFKEYRNLIAINLHGTIVSDTGLANFKNCNNLKFLALSSTKISDVGLANFKDCKKLETLNLTDTTVSDVGLAFFKGCKNLDRLELGNTRVTDAGLAYFKDCQSLTVLGLYGAQVSDAGLANFNGCKNITSLTLGSTNLSDSGLAYFRHCVNLKSLNLYGAKISDAGLAHFKDFKNLTDLTLADTKVGDAGLTDLTGCPMLKSLSLKQTKVTEAGVKKLSAALPGCKIEWDGGVIEPRSTDSDRHAAEYVLSIGGNIKIKDNGQERAITAVAELPVGPFELTEVGLSLNPKVSDAGLAQFQGCRNLTHLDLWGAPVTDAGMVYFKDCNDLKFLRLTETKVTNAGLANFKDCKQLTLLHIGKTGVDDMGLAIFKDCKNLTSLELGGTQVRGAGLAVFKDCKNLTYMNFNRSQVDDAGLAHFQGCQSITYLDLSGTRITDAGLANFRDCKNLMVLNLDGIQGATGVPLTDSGLANFSNCKQLTELHLYDVWATDAGLAHFKGCHNLELIRLSCGLCSDAGLAYFRECKNLKSLTILRGTQITDAGLANFKECHNLTILGLHCPQVSADSVLAQFRDCKNLRELGLDETRVTDAGLAHVSRNHQQLGSLSIHTTAVSDAGLLELAKLSGLTFMRAYSTRISRHGYEQLKVALPKCQIDWSESNRSVAESVLALGGTVEIGSLDQPESRPVPVAADLPGDYFQVRRVSLAGVTKPLDPLRPLLALLTFPQFDRLESIDLSGSTGLDYSFLVPIHGLRELTLANAGLNDVSLANLPKLTTLQRLVLDGNDIRGAGLTHLSHLPELIDLSLSHPNLTNLSAENLAELKPLKRLSLAGSGLTNAGIKHLATLTNLESLDLRRTKATAAGIDELKKTLPNCKIQWDAE